MNTIEDRLFLSLSIKAALHAIRRDGAETAGVNVWMTLDPAGAGAPRDVLLASFRTCGLDDDAVCREAIRRLDSVGTVETERRDALYGMRDGETADAGAWLELVSDGGCQTVDLTLHVRREALHDGPGMHALGVAGFRHLDA